MRYSLAILFLRIYAFSGMDSSLFMNSCLIVDSGFLSVSI